MSVVYNSENKKFRFIDDTILEWLIGLFSSRSVIGVFGFSGTVAEWRALSKGLEAVKK